MYNLASEDHHALSRKNVNKKVSNINYKLKVISYKPGNLYAQHMLHYNPRMSVI